MVDSPKFGSQDFVFSMDKINKYMKAALSQSDFQAFQSHSGVIGSIFTKCDTEDKNGNKLPEGEHDFELNRNERNIFMRTLDSFIKNNPNLLPKFIYEKLQAFCDAVGVKEANDAFEAAERYEQENKI